MNKLLLISMFTVSAIAKLFGGDGVKSDIKVVLPPELTRLPVVSNEGKEREMSRQKLSVQACSGLPYMSDDDKIIIAKDIYTFGKTVKKCSNIAIISVLSCEYFPLMENVRVLRLQFNVESNLLGKIQSPEMIDVPWAFSSFTQEHIKRIKKMGVDITWKPDPPTPGKGDRFLVFLSPQNQSKFEEFWYWRSPQRDQSYSSKTKLFSIGDAYNVIPLKEKKQTEDFLTAVSGYICNLREQNYNEAAYYSFLKSQMRSSLHRLKEDARSEMVKFLRSSSFYQKLAISDDGIDDRIKNYVRLILIPNQEKTMICE